MKQSAFKIHEAFRNGEAPEEMMEPNLPYLDRCYGLTPRPKGCTNPDKIDDPIFSDDDYVYHKGSTFLKEKDVFYLDTTTPSLFHLDDLELGDDLFAELSPISIHTGDSVSLITPKKKVQFVQSGDNYLFAGFDNFLLLSNSLTVLEQASPADSNTPTTICKHNSRVFYSGFKKEDSVTFSADFQAIMKVAQKYSVSFDFSTTADTLGKKHILWSTTVGGDIEASLTLEHMFIFDKEELPTYRTMIEDAFRRRQIGLIHFDWPGEILLMLPLGNRIMLYGDKAIGMLVPTEEGYVPKQLLGIGIHDRSSVDGDEGQHTFIDKNGDVWFIQNEYIPRNLFYSYRILPEFANDTASLDIRVTKHPSKNDFYICGGDKCYLLTEDRKFSESYYKVWSLFQYDNKLYGVRETGSTTWQVKTWVSDQSRNSRKMIQTVEVVRKEGSPILGCISWRNKDSEVYRTSPKKPLNNDDIFYPLVQANQTKIVLEGNISIAEILNDLRVKWQGRDLTHIRGLTEQPDEQS